MRIAFAFFGITRSLKYTIDSIKKNFFDILKKNNIDYDIYTHTYYLTNYKNKRTREKVNDDMINNDEYKLLNANYIQIDKQETIKQKLDLHSYRTHKDPWCTNYNSVDNFILGCYSKYRVTGMIEETKINYDYVIFIRPDCNYLNKLNLKYFSYVINNNIAMPNFHCFGKYKINDRFAITNMNSYKIYGYVFEKLLEMSKIQPLHSETILGEILNINNIKVIKIKFNFSRVRFNGYHQDKF